MSQMQSIYATHLRERGLSQVLEHSLLEIELAITSAERLSTPLQPIFYWGKDASTTVAVDELGYLWMCFGEKIDLSTLGFTNTSELLVPMRLRSAPKTH